MGEEVGDGFRVLEVDEEEGDGLEDLEFVVVVVEHVLEEFVETELATEAEWGVGYSKCCRVVLSYLMRVSA